MSGMSCTDVIESVTFFVKDEDNNKRESHATITQDETLRDGKPVVGGTYDSLMGTTSYEWNCMGCVLGKMKCPGHEGHMPLNYPVQNGTFREDILRWLKIICFQCGALTVDRREKLESMPLSTRLEEYTKMARQTAALCAKCGSAHPAVWADADNKVILWTDAIALTIDGKVTNVVPEQKDEEREEMEGVYQKKRPKYTRIYNHQIASIFERVSMETIDLLGCPRTSHPRRFILKCIKVPPNNIRPDIKRIGGGRSSNNDLTTMLRSIAKLNNTLPPIIPYPVPYDIDLKYTNLDMLMFEFVRGTPIGNNSVKMLTNTNRPPASIASRLPGKQNRIRANLMSARVWKVLRSVITCDPSIPVDWIGIPLQGAREIQIAEIVTRYNRDRLLIYFYNRHDTYPGCTRILKKSTGREFDVSIMDANTVLEIGDTIWRDMVDGDIVAFNRPPSLQEQYMSGFKVRVINNSKSIRMNISTCVWYNADFDGDTAAIFAPESSMSRSELGGLNSAASHFISQQTGNPFVGLLLDSLIASAEFTRADTRVTRYNAMEIFQHFKQFEAPPTRSGESLRGRDLMSILIPPINYAARAFFYNDSYAPYLRYDEDEYNFRIERGNITKGIMDYASAGQNKNKSIFHMIYNEYGPHVALECIYNIQQMGTMFLNHKSMTVSLSDIAVSEESDREVKRILSAMEQESRRITEKMRCGEIIPPINMTTREFYEQQQSAALSLGDSLIKPIIGDIDPRTNGFYRMIALAKKGSMNHYQTIEGAIGSTLVFDERIAQNFGYGRTSPYSPRFDESPAVRGFVAESLHDGQSPMSYAFQAQEARVAVVNKQMTTSVAGHMNREFIKNMESLIVNNLRQITKNRRITQFLFGGHGMNLARLGKMTIPHIMIDDAKFEAEFMGPPQMDADARRTEFEQLRADRAHYRESCLSLEGLHPSVSLNGDVWSPVNPESIIVDVLRAAEPEPVKHTGGGSGRVVQIKIGAAPVDDYKTAYEMVRDFCDDLPYVFLNNIQRTMRGHVPERYVAAVKNVCILIRAHLCTANLARRGITHQMLQLILDRCIVSIIDALLEYGVTVGIISSLSMSEPITQYIISSHHRSGVTGGVNDSQTDKLTRIREIIKIITTNLMANPSMVLRLREEYESDRLKATEIANKIEMMRVRRFLTRAQIFFEQYGKPEHPAFVHEVETIKDFEHHNPSAVPPADLTRWCIRLEFSRRTMILKNMDLDTIIYGVGTEFPYLYIVHSSEGDPVIFMRCYIRATGFSGGAAPKLPAVKTIKDQILQAVVRGVTGVHIATPISSSRSYIDQDGSVKNKKIWVIKTNGTNMSAIMENPMLDTSACTTDSLVETYEMHGIEAARDRLRIELEKALPGINANHYELFADELCNTGVMTGISRAGIAARERNNVLLRMSHGYVNQTIKAAALNATHNEVYGVSGPLMLGRAPNIGSTYNKVAIDYDFIRANSSGIQDIMDML